MEERILKYSNDPGIVYQSKRGSSYIVAIYNEYFVVLPRNTYTVQSLRKKNYEIVLYNYSAYLPNWMRVI